MNKELESMQLYSSVRQLIEQSRQEVAVTVNATITTLYWEIGRKINDEILKYNRAEYGKHVVVRLSEQLTAEYGKGWGEKHLRHCIRFAEKFQDEQIVYTLCR